MAAGGGAAMAYETDQSSNEKGREAPCESKPAGEDTPRVKDQKTRKRGKQQVNVIHDRSRPRSEDPERPDNTQQETHRASNEKSQKPILTPKTRICPICLKPSGNKLKRHIEEVHSDAMVECRGCPKKYKNVYNRSRHEKKHHPAPCSAAGVPHRSTSTAREVGST